ncbi:conserved hypothetical protein [Pyrobaculum arsenaticum DSM 13514]|uniref:Transmembrane protein n=1 Tax=Pyrobaculum arsenaticum (strain DSM 13514 / JCM 11321 / PZ6) TaxID=340102 RepID=A4WN31_PYRAR|nr:conserved hypothetical protein [Pyrobaculum arsenaticum DSM 13514]
MQYRKILYLIAVVIIASVYALIVVTYNYSGCLPWPQAAVMYSNTGSPFYIVATLDALTRYDSYYCTNPVYAFSTDMVHVTVFVQGPNQYFDAAGQCLLVGQSIGKSVNPNSATSHGVVVAHTCTSAKSYYYRIKYSAYYN